MLFQLLEKKLPLYRLDGERLLFVSYWADLHRFREPVAALFHGHRPHFYVQLGWEAQSRERLARISSEHGDFLRLLPGASVTFLANSSVEVERLVTIGCDAIHCHQNAFLDESLYRPLSGEKPYSAVILSRITPFKRYELARDLRDYLIIGDWSERERDYATGVLSGLEGYRRIRKVMHRHICRHLNQARCGVMLSAAEGANFASAEYLLCGLPVVSTRSIGGRDELFEDGFVEIADDDAASVRRAVDRFQKERPDPDLIRNRTIEKMLRFRNILETHIRETHRFPEFDLSRVFCHKFLLRRNRWLELPRYQKNLLGWPAGPVGT